MAVTSVIGATLLAGVVGKLFTTEKRKIRGILKATFKDAGLYIKKRDNSYSFPVIKKIKKMDFGFRVMIEIPNGFPVDKFRDAVPVLGQAAYAETRFRHVVGRLCQLDLGTKHLPEKVNYSDDHLFKQVNTMEKSLAIPVVTAFGVKYIDFWDEATCHLLVGGATRMGKSVFLRLLFVHLMRLTKGNIEFVYINNKVEDYFPVQGCNQIPFPAETIPEAIAQFELVLDEINSRRETLRRARCVNAKTYRERFPDGGMKPLFVVIDEYGRFAESKEAQELVQTIAETAGYLDVHLVIATQRPDVSTVLKPRIRANMLARIGFSTTDEANSNIIVGTPDCAHLGRVQGRAVYFDGFPVTCQIPYVSEEQAHALLSPYWSDGPDVNQERQDDSAPADTLPSFVKGSVRNVDLPGTE